MLARAVQCVVVCKMNACAYHTCLLCCHAFGNGIERDDVLMRQPRAKSGPDHMYCLFATSCIIQDYPCHDD